MSTRAEAVADPPPVRHPLPVARPFVPTALRGINPLGAPDRRLLAVVLVCTGLAAISLVLPWSPTFDPWAWLVWGREVAHLALKTGAAPSWKPLPVIFTTAFFLVGKAAPALWLVVSRSGALVALAMVARLAGRLAAGPLRWLAALIAGAGLLLTHDYLRRSAAGNAEALMVGLGLLALERHLDGHRRQALVLAGLAALVRPEIWPFLGAYACYFWLVDRRARALAVAALALVPALWFGGPLWGSGDAFQASHAALVPLRESAAAATQHHGLRVVSEFVAMLPIPVKLLAPLGLVFLLRRQRQRALAMALAVAGLGWLAIVALLAQHGYAGVPRYLFMPAAFASILAGVGLARIVDLAAAASPPLLHPRISKRRLAMVGVPVVAAITVLSLPGVRLLRTDAQALTREGARDNSLGRAIKLAGGPGAVLACGAPVTGWFETTALAWHLGVDLTDVHARTRRGPEVIFIYREGRPGIGGRIPHNARVLETASWRIVERCRAG